MGGDDAFGHGQPKARTLDSRCLRGVRTDEFLENLLLLGSGDPDALDQRFNAVDKRLDGIDKRIDSLAGDWRVSLDVHERLAALAARFEKR